MPAGPTWQRLTLSFDAVEAVTAARLRFLVGDRPGAVWLDGLSLSERLANLYRREFANGLVLLNGTRQARAVNVGQGYRRLVGSQAPFYEFILDVIAPTFTISGTWTEVTTAASGRPCPSTTTGSRLPRAQRLPGEAR